MEKTREAVEQCVNGINEAIELVKSTAATLNAEHEDDDEEEEGAKAEQKENTYNVGGDDHDEAVSRDDRRALSNAPSRIRHCSQG